VTPEVSPSPPGTDAIASIDETVETDSSTETGTGATETLPGDTSPTDEPVEQHLTNKEKAAILGIGDSNLSKWVKKGSIPEKYANKCRFNSDKTKIILT
jgi:hypothetical protein